MGQAWSLPNTREKYCRNAKLFPQRHLEVPNDLLWNNQDGNIRGAVEGSGNNIEGFDIQATTPFQPWFPIIVHGIAREYLNKGADGVEEEVEPYQGVAYPECNVSSSRAENTEVLEEDGKFDDEDYETVKGCSNSYLL